jgi:hypothetical protein
MNKELIIINYYFDVGGMTRQQAEETISIYNNLIIDTFDDDELKQNYIIKNMCFPSDKTKIECIYPTTNQNTTIDLDIEMQIKTVETAILKLKDPKLWDEWNILMRWAKLKNIKEKDE